MSRTGTLLISTSIITIFILGFYYDENSTGAGGYYGDLIHIWNNQNTFNHYTFFKSINFTAIYAPDYFQSSRMPLSYILNKYLNPLNDNILNFRKSIFFISFLVPIILYKAIKLKFPNASFRNLLLISLFVFLSPYYRTSAYWGLEENYGIIVLILSYIFLSKFIENDNFLNLFFLTFFSSVCVYFDQKLLLIPIICCATIVLSNKSNQLKGFALLLYFFFSLPCFYFIYIWKSVMPVVDAANLGLIHFENIAYSISIISFYIFPLIFFKEKFAIENFKSFFKSKFNLISLIIFIFYIIYFFLINQTKLPLLGGGILTKASIILFKSALYQNIFFSTVSLFCFVIVLFFLEKNLNDILIIFFLILVSLIANPLYQEYFDPLLVLLAFTFFKNKIKINNYNTNFLLMFYSLLLIINNIYY